MDVLLGKVPNVTADLIRKAFYPADEHVADGAAAFLTDRRFLCCWDQGGGEMWPTVDLHLPLKTIKADRAILWFIMPVLLDEYWAQGGSGGQIPLTYF